MKKVIITGATGFIGGALTKELLKRGVTVYGVDIDAQRLEAMKEYGKFIPVVADFSVYYKLAELIGEKDFDVFYHFAWQGVFGEAFKDYALQLKNAQYACDCLMCASQIMCKKFVLAGTYNQYEIITRLTRECNSPRFTCIYSSAKTVADLMCKTLASNYGIDYNAGLICMAYGEGNRSKMLANVVINQLIKDIRPKLIEGEGLYDMIYIDDIVSAFIAIGEKGINQRSYYVGHRVLKTFGEIITDIKNIICPEMKLIFGEYKETTKLDYSLIDLESLHHDTGFECKANFRESILKTAEWVKTLEI